MKKIHLCLPFLAATLLPTIGKEEDARKLIETSEEVSQRAGSEAQALMNSLSIETKKFKMSMKDVPLKQSSKKCHAQQGPRIRPDKCSTNLPFPGSESSGSQKTSAKFLIFVSTSMPQQSIKTLGQEAHKIGAKIIFRGLIGGTFKETQNYMQSLGVTAEIDPTKFEDYKIVQVPTFILEHNKVRDHVAGHVSIWAALEQFKNRGELKAEAQKLYNQLKQHLGQGVHS